ncbi:MAG: hypothetical protein JZU53_16675 [Paludibacter sp.]|nr:hypothetical protein [Paludibacter sp.]
MNYDIKIQGDPCDNGKIALSRMGVLAKSSSDVITRSLALKIFGYSDVKLPSQWVNALDVQLEKVYGDSKIGTNLLLDCNPLASQLRNFQTDAFKPELVDELKTLTPMALLITAFSNAINENSDKNSLDKPLLKSLIQFKKNFVNDNETFYFSNRNSIPAIEIKKVDFRKIELLVENTPEPNKVSVCGKLDELKHSKQSIVIVVDGKRINANAKDESIIESIKEFFGHELVITGMAHYKPGGALSFIEIQEFREPQSKDNYLSKVPSAMSAKQQMLFHVKENKGTNLLSSLIGEWPGTESIDEILNDID